MHATLLPHLLHKGAVFVAVTIRDVAALAGVSPSTVSRTCRNNPSISEETKERVRRAAKQLGYAMEGISTPATRTVGVILPPSAREVYENPFYLEMIRGINQFCNAHQYVSTIVTGRDNDEILSAVRLLVSSGAADAGIAQQIVVARNKVAALVDPTQTSNATDLMTVAWNFEGLVFPANDGTAIEGALAESWDVSEDGLTYTFHLRDGLKFYNGDAVTAEDILYSLNRAIDPEKSIFAGFLTAIAGIECPDDTTVVVTLKAPTPDFLSNFTMPCCAIVQKDSGESGDYKDLVTCGPYYIADWVKDQYMLFKKNPNYYDPSKAVTEEIKVTVVADDSTRLMEFQNGDIDLMMSTPRNNLPQLSADSNYKVEAFDTVTVNYIGFNVEAEAVSSKEVRQALAYATNVDDLIVGANQGYAQRVTTFTDNLDVLRNTGLEGYTHDVEKAKSLLADAGYADGLTLTLSITSGNTTEAQIAAILKEQWAQAGVTLEVTQYDAATLTAMKKNGEYQVGLTNLGRTGPDSALALSFIVYNPITNGMYTGWQNDECESLYLASCSELDVEKRAEMWARMQEIELDEAPLIPTYVNQDVYAMHSNVSGVQYNLFLGILPYTMQKTV